MVATHCYRLTAFSGRASEGFGDRFSPITKNAIEPTHYGEVSGPISERTVVWSGRSWMGTTPNCRVASRFMALKRSLRRTQIDRNATNILAKLC